MAKVKIKRGLSDRDMVGNWQETASFEHGLDAEPAVKPVPPARKESFFSPELQEKVSKNLLAIKLDLFQQGILDYDLHVSREGNRVILTATARKTNRK
ncbi:MAG: hypothetical protein E6X17_12030 [Sporomusaceae bacterium]|nr:hypothetical protein [Sporomusaceae bacterium]